MKSNIIDTLLESGTIWMVLGSLVSADNLVDANACEKSLNTLEMMERELDSSMAKGNDELRKRIYEAKMIVNGDLFRFKGENIESI